MVKIVCMTKREYKYHFNKKATSGFYGLIPRLNNKVLFSNISSHESLVLHEMGISEWLNATPKPQPLVTSKEVYEAWQNALTKWKHSSQFTLRSYNAD